RWTPSRSAPTRSVSARSRSARTRPSWPPTRPGAITSCRAASAACRWTRCRRAPITSTPTSRPSRRSRSAATASSSRTSSSRDRGDAVEVRTDQVGVRTLKVGKDPAQLAPDPAWGHYVVPGGFRGVQMDPVPPGTYYLNPYVETITPVEVRSHRVELADIEFPSRDGFILKPHVFVEYRVQPEKAPELQVRLTDQSILHQADSTPEEQQQNEILQKVILP